MRTEGEAVRPCSLALIGAVMGIAAAAAAAEEPATRHLSVETGVETGVELGLQLAGERNLFWNLPEVFAPAGVYDTDRHWWEAYVKPSVHAQRPLPGGAVLYGQLSAVGSGTLEKDPFDAGNTGRLTLETAVAGVRTPLAGTAWQADLSLGAQAFTVGTGMLIANGASNGFDRGALKLGPRKAFERTAVARLTDGATTAEAFYLDPNENPDSDSRTRLLGAALTYEQPDADRLAGLAVGRVIESTAPYVQAAPGGSGPPTILDGARDGLRFVHAFGRWPVFERLRPGLWLGADVAWERNPRIDLHARAWRLQAGAAWNDRAWRPKLTVGMQRFSGDDPSTPGLERFDPLFYEGSPGAWASGSKASMVFINTNVRALQASLALQPTPRDIVTVYLAHLRADELRSPLQFGQATRVDIADGVSSIVAGVTHPHLADDVFVKYTRVVDRHTYVTAGYSASFPGAAIQRLLGGRSPVWSGWLVNLVLAY
jgi:hypothetical protein